MENKATEEKLAYGWSSFRPRLLQFLNTPKWFLFFLCQYFFTQSVIANGVFPASVSTIERRFGYSSSMLGVLTGTYDIAALLFSPFVGYLGETRRKPLWCSCGLFVMGLGFFIFLVPHLIIGHYEAGSAKALDPDLCEIATNLTNATSVNGCGTGSTSNTGLYVIFLLGMFLIGTGATPMVVLAFPYLDENLKATVVPMYMGFFYASGILGLLVGSVLGSIFLSIYVDIGVVTSLTEGDERWVGAWWLGFAIFSAAAVFWSVWMMGFPKEFPGTRRIREAAREEKDETAIGSMEARYVKITDIVKATRHLFTYPSYIFLTSAVCAEEFMITTVSAFIPKILQLQFRFTASEASVVFGIIAGVSALTGNLLGAYINKRLRLNCRGAARMCFVVSIFSLVFTIPLFIGCDSIPIAGVNSPYLNSTLSTSLNVSCNDKCGCANSLQYNPICGDGVTYFSPCHAGCSRGTSRNNTFFDCSCVAGSGNHTWPGGETRRGVCQTDCGSRPVIFLVVMFFVAFFTFLNNIPASFVTLRCVPVDQRSYAIGLQWDVIRLFGTIPGPIIFGHLIDRACVLWDNRCGERGSCLAYNNYHLGLAVLFLCLTCKLVATTSFGLSWLFCRRQFRGTGNRETGNIKPDGGYHNDKEQSHENTNTRLY